MKNFSIDSFSKNFGEPGEIQHKNYSKTNSFYI